MFILTVLYWYCVAFEEYDRLNKHLASEESFLRSLNDETKELLEATSVSNFIEEFFDVIHAKLRLSFYKFGIYQCYLSYLTLAILAFPTAFKHAKRYYTHGCPRSMNNHDAAGKGKDSHVCYCRK